MISWVRDTLTSSSFQLHFINSGQWTCLTLAFLSRCLTSASMMSKTKPNNVVWRTQAWHLHYQLLSFLFICINFLLRDSFFLALELNSQTSLRKHDPRPRTRWQDTPHHKRTLEFPVAPAFLATHKASMAGPVFGWDYVSEVVKGHRCWRWPYAWGFSNWTIWKEAAIWMFTSVHKTVKWRKK